MSVEKLSVGFLIVVVQLKDSPAALWRKQDLRLPGDTEFPKAQSLEGRGCQGFLVRVTQILPSAVDAEVISIS